MEIDIVTSAHAEVTAPSTPLSSTVTDPTGRWFISYRRSRLAEVKRLITALHEHGVPTWQDLKDLAAEPTVEALQRCLDCPTTAGAILWCSKDVADSNVILQEEAPRILSRGRKADGFTAKLCLADELKFEDAGKILRMPGSIEDPSKSWNLLRVDGNPATDASLLNVARATLTRRLSLIHRSLAPGAPIRIGFHAHEKAKPAFELGYGLIVDWTSHFTQRHAACEVWTNRLAPALSNIVEAIRIAAPKRPVTAEGFASLTAAFALGRAFMEPAGIPTTWRQLPKGDSWTLKQVATTCPLSATLASADPGGTDLALMVSIRGRVEPAVVATSSILPSFRAILRVEAPDGLGSAQIANTEEASAVARLVGDELRKARAKYPVTKKTHLFYSGPAGVAMMIGQLLNAVGPVQLYEHKQTADNAIGTYVPSALLCDAA